MPKVMVVARNFMDMVAPLPASKLDMLYDSAFICEAVRRSLPPLGKKYAVQMLYVSAPVATTALEEWVIDEYAAKHNVAIDRLLQFRVFVEVCDSGSLPWTPLLPSIIAGRLPTISELEDYALEQWERFLLQLIKRDNLQLIHDVHDEDIPARSFEFKGW